MEIRFGSFVLDLTARQLLCEGRRVPLSPKVYQLLCVLAEERPRALSRQELHARLWPDTFVSDVNLACLVNELRVALGDCRGLVRTVHRFGYAFDVPASTAGPVPLAGAPVLVLVLPVTALDVSSGPAAAELTDELVTRLTGAGGFSAVPLCAAGTHTPGGLDLPRLSRDRGIAFVVEASTRTGPAGLHVNARLVDAASGSCVWSHRAIVPPGQLPDLHGWLAGALVEAMIAARPRRRAADRTSGAAPVVSPERRRAFVLPQADAPYEETMEDPPQLGLA